MSVVESVHTVEGRAFYTYNRQRDWDRLLALHCDNHKRLVDLLAFAHLVLDMATKQQQDPTHVAGLKHALKVVEQDAERIGNWMQDQVYEAWFRLPLEERRKILHEVRAGR